MTATTSPAPALDRDALERTRRAVLAASPVGQAAARIHELCRELRDALDDFLKEYPDAEATRAVAAAALGEDRATAAVWTGWAADHFDPLPAECRGWMFLVGLMGDLLESYAPG